MVTPSLSGEEKTDSGEQKLERECCVLTSLVAIETG